MMMINSIIARVVVTTRQQGLGVCTAAYHHRLDASLQVSSSPTKSSRLFSSSQQHPTTTTNNESSLSTPSDINKEQIQLLKEATYLTKTLYRQCLKSVQLLARGNERDEIDFMEREMAEKDQLDDFLSSSSPNNDNNDNNSSDASNSNNSSSNSNSKKSKLSIMAGPPVNRQNELSSRANYYKAFTREHFDGHYNLLGRHGFHLGDEGNMRHGLGYHHQHQPVGGGGVGHQEENRYMGGHHHLGGQMSPQYSSSHSQETTTSTTVKNDASTSESSSDSSSSDGEYYMWREEQIEQFIYLITKGEEKRQWILNDYEFNDPCNNNNNMHGGEGGGHSGNNNKNWPEELHDRISKFEERANLVVKEMYRRQGWVHSSDFEYSRDDDEDAFSDDEEEEL